MKNKKLFWGSSYDRGLDVLLMMWSDIKKEHPEATLDICYGWDLFDKAYRNNKERQLWKRQLQELMKQDGITHHGRIGQDELKKVRSKCGIWSYPTYFTEIFCITAVECQNDGLVPVTMNLAALSETAKKGILIDGDIKDKSVFNKYVEELTKLMGDKKTWKNMSNKCQKFARKFDWSKISNQWVDKFEQEKEEIRVTVYTPTIREGWWNLMSNNLAAQEYQNFEWVIVDAHKDDRSHLAKKYSDMYGLDINYIHQKPTNRTYSLCNANNIAIEEAEGELFVFLQDFVLLKPTAIQELVTVSQKHPGDFIAPTDIYFKPKIKPNTENKEDWFDGEIDVIGEFLRKNVRNEGRGIRPTETLTDFEQNYGAVPTSTLRHLNGYWEFYDEALGWDDTEIIYRAKKLGYGLWIDDTNQCVCIDHWGTLGNNEGGSGVNRSRRANNPRFLWMMQQMESGKLPVIRDEKLEKNIHLLYEVPEDVPDDECEKWVKENYELIVSKWKDAQ